MVLKTYKATIAMRETLILMIQMCNSLEEETHKHEQGREDAPHPLQQAKH